MKIDPCVTTLQKLPKMSYFTNHYIFYLNLVDKRVSLTATVTVTASEIFAGEKILAYLHHLTL